MTTTFLGKWRFFVFSDDVVVSNPHFKPGEPGLVIVKPPLEYPKYSNIAFSLRSDSQLSFLVNSGQYVVEGPFNSIVLWDTLDNATGFTFPGHDVRNLPTSFKSKIQAANRENGFVTHLNGALWLGTIQISLNFDISQVTPPLTSVQARGNADGADFAWVDLTNGSLEKVSLVGVDFSHCNLTSFKFLHCLLRRAQLNNCTLTGTDFSGSNFAGANLNQVDLTAVVANPIPEFYTKPLQPPSHDNPRTTLFGSRLNQSLLGNDWSMLDLTGTTILNLSSPLSSQGKPLLARHSLLTGLNKNNFSGLSLQYAVFDNAVLDSVSLDGCDLSNASLIQASMHETVLSNATLKNATMTGAQLGSLSQLFTLPPGFETHLNAPAVDTALRDQFAQHAITLSTNTSLNTLAMGRVWQLNDAGNKISYTIRLEGESPKVLTVYKPGVAASLVNAYMPNAVLTGANLYGVVATGAQFYGSRARLDGSAILERVEFNDANLSTVNFTQAQMMGANLSYAQLFNAKFNKANLTPSVDGVATNLSNANLQGADFTDARLDAANLTNAAVAINVPTKFNSTQGGVYLFSLPYKADSNTLQQYTTELTAAASRFSLNPDGNSATLQMYVTALKSNNLTPLKAAFLKHQPPVVLSSNAQIKNIEVDSVWQIVDQTQSYTLWTGPDQRGNTQLYTAPSLTKMQAAFKRSSMTLRWQASASIDTADQQWLLDNDSENPQNFSTGYVMFIVKLNGSVLDVYGAALRILRLGDHQQEEFDTETCQITILSQTNINADTICPNGATLSVNQSRSGKTWDTLWLRAETPPRPPDCVPTDFNWCPPPSSRPKTKE